jgi:hypothetical protein
MAHTMLVCDLEREHEAKNDAELEHALMKRYGSGVNHFRLFRDRGEWPSLVVMVSGEVAWLYFLSSTEHAGYHSLGVVPGLDSSGSTRFVSLGPQEEHFPNDQLVPFADAVRAAKEFSVSGQLPQCIKWRELT